MKQPKRYEVHFEIAGRAAMFARPDTGSTPTSYPLPTFSACKAMLECVALLRDGAAWFRPTEVSICRRLDRPGQPSLRWLGYTTNYGGPLRKSNQVRDGNNLQLIATALADPCYRITAAIEGVRPRGGRNPRHHLQDLFERRLRQGRVFRTPCLGWSEFTADYWGPFRDGQGGRPHRTEVDTSVEMTIPSMLFSVWDRAVGGRVQDTFVQDVSVRAGTLRFPDTLPEGVADPAEQALSAAREGGSDAE